jgi:hypothetical protein
LREIFGVAQGIDSKTMTLQYLEALKAIGASESTKFVIPTEFVNLVRPLMAHAGRAAEETSAGE